ncbi:MAG: transglutaminase family protein [Desulfosarcinaceae bacterium]|nr:transglutaminase family protein [Desulfosarcinaceae bacterium]
MTYRIHHETRYRYAERTTVSYNEIRLCPRTADGQSLEEKKVHIEPPPAELRERTDYFGNVVWYVAIQQPHEQMRVTVDSRVRLNRPALPADLSQSVAWEAAVERLQSTADTEITAAAEYLLNSPLIAADAALAAYARPSFAPHRPLMLAVSDLMQRIHAEFEFMPGITDTTTPLSEVLKHRKGVCQDFAQLAIGCLRSMGLAARYVSGYIETLPPPGKEKLQGADASHAWCAVFVPDFGWLEFDPTNNLLPFDQHIVVGYGRDFTDVTPIKGVIYSAGQQELSVSVDVDRLDT